MNTLDGQVLDFGMVGTIDAHTRDLLGHRSAIPRPRDYPSAAFANSVIG